jgi:hypothetical protein
VVLPSFMDLAGWLDGLAQTAQPISLAKASPSLTPSS